MKKIPWWYTEIGEAEKQKVLSAFERKCFSQGPFTEELESKIASTLGVPYVVLTPSGTSAIAEALIACDVGVGDEVIVPDLTWIATAQAAAILGARVILVDCLPDSPLMDPDEVRKKITKRTKAIIPVHLNGRPCRMDELDEMSRNAGILLIEDACKAFASRTSKGYLGTLGNAGCFSMSMVSPISIGYGGAVATRDKNTYEKLKLIRNQGVPRTGDEKYEMLGFNFKVSDVLAAIGLAQMSRLPEKLKHINAVYNRYVKGLSSLSFIKAISVDVSAGQVPLCAEFSSQYRDEIITYLEEQGVEALKFHLPLHLAAHLKGTGKFPNASRFAREGFILPCGPSQPLENVDRCIELLQKWYVRH